MRSKLLFVIFVCLSGFVVSPLQVRSGAQGRRTGSIRGRVDLRRVPPPAEPRPNVADLGAATLTLDLSDRLKSVVYLESAPRGAFETVETTHAVMDQRGERFVPHVLAITTGTIVDFPNSDQIYHNVFSLSKTRPFDLGRYAAGRSKPVRFDKPGIVRVFCDIHAHMSAWILVFAHAYFAATGPDGSWRIPNVPAGTWTLDVWTDGEVRETRTVTVTAEDRDLAVDFVVR